MRVLVSGSTGLLGSAVVQALEARDDIVLRLVRSSKDTGEEEVLWDIENQSIDRDKLEGIDAVIHLAGEPIAGPRWTVAKKRKIRDSRVQGTKLLTDALLHLDNPPKHYLCASAIGFYGDRGDTVLTEDASPGDGFLSSVCREWEAAAQPAANASIRVVNMRFGVVLSGKGGALPLMLKPFKMGVGGQVGNGKQYMAWITRDDLVGVVLHILDHPEISGAVNVVAPEPVTNKAFTKIMGNVLNRPTAIPTPAFAVRMALGEMADEMLLASARVVPDKLKGTEYVYRFPDLETALRHEIDEA